MVPSDQDVNAFLDSVSEVSRLIDGLKAGAISPEYVDSKIAQKSQKKADTNKPITSDAQAQAPAAQTPAGQDAAATDTARQAELMRKVEELKTSRQRKLKARQLYESYVQGKQKQQHSYATDYNQWELWCPSDDEDDLFNSLTPNSPQFRAMEQDITARHARMVEQRQLAERQRQLGNAAFKAGQLSEALRCYEVGLEAQRHNMTLHANAAMAALKLKCFVTAQEHCDKVLHLAEVLHNTPKHALCIKALQRRAAAYQGLGQYSKAVADLQAAADILPGDAEVTEQLQRAQVLLKEHKTVKQLARLVEPTAQQALPGATEPTSASSAGACTADSSSPAVDKRPCSNSTSTTITTGSNSSSVSKSSTTEKDMADVLRLQRIKQLTTTLVETCSKAATDSLPAVQACDELQGLVAGTQYSLFFRKCGGLEAASKLVLKSNDAAAQAVGLQLLNTVCDCDTAVEQLSEQMLGAILDMIASQQGVAAQAALELAYSASICNTVRSRLCVQLVKEPPQQQLQAGTAAGKSRLVSMWDLCCKAPTSGLTTTENMQVLAISLISNCMLVPTARAALAGLLQQAEGTLDRLAAQLGSCGPAFAVKVLGLLSNMCNHAALRGQLAGCQQLMQQVLQLASRAVHVQPVTELAVSALGCLCNLALEQSVQQLLCTRKDFVVQLVQLATAGPDCSAAFKESCSSDANTSSSSSHGSGGRATSVAGLQLPPRAKDKHSKGVSSLPGAAETAAVAGAAGVPLADHSCLSARAASLLSRVAKQAVGVEVLQQQGALGAYADAISALLSRPLATSGQTAEQLQQQAQQSKDAAETSQLAAQWLAAAVHTMALLTAVPDLCSSCSTGHAAAAIQSCCQVLRSSNCEDAVRGNAALVVKGFAGASDHRWHAQLAEADAVQALIAAASSGRGNPSSRNAGIALALLARCGGVFIERVRELRGLEVLHEYVRP